MSAQAAAKLQTNATYEEIPYESGAFPQTHPAHMHMVGTLFGLTPPDFRTARVLELGCASGGNILPLALKYPKASFTGLDFSGAQIAMANQQKQTLKVSNVEFIEQDISTFAPKNKEKFDYIICHGVFSWVPENVRTKILSLCSEWLSPNGLAVISYNVLPGWNAVRSLREMMLYHIERFNTPAEKIMQARSLLAFLAENATDERSGYRALIEEEINKLNAVNSASYFFHDHLETHNTQFYLHDFVRQVKAQGLEYVGDSSIGNMYSGNMPLKAAQVLQTINNDAVAQEQYMDFILNRRFRSSILTKDGSKLNRALNNTQILNYHLTVNPQMTVEGGDVKKDMVFRIGASSFTTHEPVSSTLFSELHACGIQPIAANDLIARVQKKLGYPDAQRITQVLLAHGLPLALQGYINLHSDSFDYVTDVSKKPVAYPVARYQAAMPGCNKLTNAAFTAHSTDAFVNLMLRHMDGSKTVSELGDILVAATKTGELIVSIDGVPLPEADIRKAAGEIMQRLARIGMLVG